MIVLPNMGLVKWDSLNDAFSHEQLAANFQALDAHDHTPGKGVPIPYGGLAEQSVGPENLRQELTHNSIKWYTPKIVTAEESRESTSYGTLSTADEIPNVVVPTNGLLMVQYDALWRPSVTGAGRAALFLGENQLKVVQSEFVAPVTQAAVTGEAGIWKRLFTQPVGLMGGNAGEIVPATNVTTGQALGYIEGGGNKMKMEISGEVREFDWGGVGHPSIWGSWTVIRVNPGTYNLTVRYKASSGNVKAKERRLYAMVLGL